MNASLFCLSAAAVFAPSLSAAVVAGATDAPSLCQQLAARVWQSPATAGKVVADGIVLAAGATAPVSREQDETVTALLRKSMQLPEEGPGSILEVESLPGTSLYMGSSMAGTAECQSSLFAQIQPDGSARVLALPQGYTGPCWNVHGGLGTVLGNPAYVESGTVSSTTADTLTRITPWSATGWGRACQLTVEYKYKLRLRDRFCGQDAACANAESRVMDIVQSYLSYLKDSTPPDRAIDTDEVVPEWNYLRGAAVGRQGDQAVINGWHYIAGKYRTHDAGTWFTYKLYTSTFPTFDHDPPNGGWDFSFSYVNFTFFPLELEGRLYLGAIAHNGVGWREGSDTLVALYAAPPDDQHGLVPLAGYVVQRDVDTLKGTVVAEGDSAVPRRRE